MQNKANFSKSQMLITATLATNYSEKCKLDTWSKRTQTKPISEGTTYSRQVRELILKHIFQGTVVGFAGAEGGDLFEFNDSADIVQA
jgi:hypothetical protein